MFQWEFPCHPTDLFYFKKRIGRKGTEKIFRVYIELQGKKAEEGEVLVDTTVQGKNTPSRSIPSCTMGLLSVALAFPERKVFYLSKAINEPSRN